MSHEFGYACAGRLSRNCEFSLELREPARKIHILVENLGHINYNRFMQGDLKGSLAFSIFSFYYLVFITYAVT